MGTDGCTCTSKTLDTGWVQSYYDPDCKIHRIGKTSQ